ncbi:MAG TPA: PQQ-dependent sugar dehydrogenase, partial [Kofleriaceae bacterium]|nr:PQQ-dependent sugar dehydrogenase [Kofleriaceae bacterium]
ASASLLTRGAARTVSALLCTAVTASLSACGGSSSPPPSNSACPGSAPGVWVSDARYCVTVFADELGHPRQMAFAPGGELFVNNGSVTVVADDDGNGTSAHAERSTYATAPGLNHGIAFSPDGAYVYASSQTTVYRWRYTRGARKAAGEAEIVVQGIPSGGHVTRTLVFDSSGRLYVSVGSASNVDVDPVARQTRGQIRRFTVPASLPAQGLEYATGEVVASGMRNEVGLYMDAHDRMWGVENGRDVLSDQSGDIHNGNPAEEVNLIDGTGASFYGYPICFSEFALSGGLGAGTQWADITLDVADRKTDGWCRDPAQVHPPAFALPAHWAPLGVVEYQGDLLPLDHDLIVAAHGSWNADPAVGRVLARLHRNGDTITSFEPILGERGPDGALRQGVWDARPVDVREAADGSLYFSDDQGGRVFKVSYLR